MVAATLIKRPRGCWIGSAGDSSYFTALLIFDATIKETFHDTSVVTRQPVEQGVDITDHVRPEPSSISLDALITNSPLQDLNGFGPGADNAAAAYQLLLSLKNNATFLSISTAIRDYDNMLITSIDVDRDKTAGQSLSVKLNLQSVLIVSSLQVPVPKKPAGTTKKQVGAKSTTETTSAQQTTVFTQLTGIGL